MRTAELLAAFAALAGLGIASIFIGTAVSDRIRAAILIAFSLIVAAALTPVGVQVGTGWIAAALALAGALTLAWGWLESRLVWFVGPVMALAAHGAWSLISPALAPMAATGLLVLVIAGGLTTGYALHRLRLRAWFVDLSSLSMFVGLAFMAGPVLSMGWRRAAIAAEGQDPAPAHELTLMWPLALAGLAFAAGLGWKLVTTARGFK
jgi:hypothetical protein